MESVCFFVSTHMRTQEERLITLKTMVMADYVCYVIREHLTHKHQSDYAE